MRQNQQDNNCADLRGPAAARVRRQLTVRGRVQGVGFRPFVYRLAGELSLSGSVRNDMQGASVEVEGPGRDVSHFIRRLKDDLPVLAKISSLSVRSIPVAGEGGFVIDVSSVDGRQDAEISPDAATCPDCLSELTDPSDRRFGYPFINCTNCGPRYSIIQSVPYDRPNTTMSAFDMCPICRGEYDDPADRRFHAQPNACPTCGPRVWMVDRHGEPIAGDAVDLCRTMLADGRIIAIKGLGGFHLACRADSDDDVARLRLNKARRAKPFAIMAASLAAAGALVELDDVSTAALTGPARPIVLLPRLPNAPVSRYVAPGVSTLGVMLPYTPLHHLLFDGREAALVMTSGNPSREPLSFDNAEAIERLAEIADAFLLHDRDIERRVDDSVVAAMRRTTGDGASVTFLMPLRRARGCVPAPVIVPDAAPTPVLALGGELKSTICILSGDSAVLSEHLGDLDNPQTYRHFLATIDQFKRILRVQPKVAACDMHADYAATRHARRLDMPVVHVQHHHAHVVSCMADAGLTGEVIGIACDGVGYGTDGQVWGCEIMRCDQADFQRLGHLRYFPLLGGDAAALETWRPAAGVLFDALGPAWTDTPAVARMDAQAVRLAASRLAGPGTHIRTSSLGRLFDAAAFLLGVCDHNSYEGQAAMMLEARARASDGGRSLQYSITDTDGDGPIELDIRPMIRQIIDAVDAGQPTGELARAFHLGVADMLADAVTRIAERTGLRRVALSGGCFANRLLVARLTELLHAAGLEAFTHISVPTGDGGIALGQAVVAAARYDRGLS